nr:Uncharacterised protein [Raoultella sp. NCTC 9187]
MDRRETVLWGEGCFLSSVHFRGMFRSPLVPHTSVYCGIGERAQGRFRPALGTRHPGKKNRRCAIPSSPPSGYSGTARGNFPVRLASASIHAGGPGQPPAPQRFLAGPTPQLHVPMPHGCMIIAEKAFSNDLAAGIYGLTARGLRRIKKTGENGRRASRDWPPGRRTERQVETGMSSPARSAR